MNSNYYLVVDNALKTLCTWKLQAEVVVAPTCNYSTEENRDRRITNYTPSLGYTVRPCLKPSEPIFKKLLGRPIILRSIIAEQI